MRFAALLLCSLITGPALAADGGVPFPRALRHPLASKPDEARVERVCKALSLRERAAQVVMAYPQISKSAPVEVGGVLFVGTSLNNLPKARERITSSYQRARVPPFVAVDMEGGPFNRMKKYPGLKGLPVARDLAALDDKEVWRWGKRVGEAMRELGLNMNLAPVLDVAASGHMFDNQRSFSGDEGVVVTKATAYSKGLLAAGVVPIGKHFPGYGDLAADSDHGLATAEWKDAVIEKNIAVFHKAADVLGGVMLSNIVYTAFEPRPAILSSQLVRKAHERDWLAVTDDVSIQVLADSIEGSSEDVLKQALLAGNDLILTTAPPDWDKGLDYVGILTKFAQEDEVAKQRVDEACLRLMRLKDRMGLLEGW